MSDTYEYRKAEMDMIASAFPELEEDSRTCRVVAGALRNRLTPKQRQTLLLHYGAGMNISQIARMRGVYPSTVWRTLNRAKRQLMWAARLGGIDIAD